MKSSISRRDFIKLTTMGGLAMGLTGYTGLSTRFRSTKKIKVGIIGLDTSHCVAFTKALNDPDAAPDLAGYPVVAAYPKGSLDIESSVSRIPQYTREIKKNGRSYCQLRGRTIGQSRCGATGNQRWAPPFGAGYKSL